MAEIRPIPTPLIYRWRRFVQNVLPTVMFFVALVLAVWLWDRQSQMGNAIGVVESQFVDVPSGAAGILMPPGHGAWREFQTVKRDEVIGAVRLAQLDTYAAQIETIQKEKEKVRADLVAAREQFLLQMRQLYEGEWFDLARQHWRVEDIRLDLRDRETRIRLAQAQLRTEMRTLDFNERSFARGGAISDQEVTKTRFRTKEFEQLIAREGEAQGDAKSIYLDEFNRLQSIKRRLESLNSERGAEIEKVATALTAPFLKELDVLDARTREIQAATNSLVIRAPLDGVVTEVFAVPGQSVQPGDPVIRIASENSDYIISYVRSRQRVRPVPNMMVKLRTRHTGSRPVKSSVVEVGPQVEPVPLNHLYDPVRPEWGYPIKIALPDDLRSIIKPGEQIDIIFPARTEVVVPQEPTKNVPDLGV